MTASQQIVSTRSLVRASSSSEFGNRIVGDVWWSSSGSIASLLNRSLKGVNFVALDSEVLCDHNTIVSSSAHFPFGLSCNFLEMPWRMILLARSTRPLDWGCLTKAKQMFMPSCWPNSLKRSQLN